MLQKRGTKMVHHFLAFTIGLAFLSMTLSDPLQVHSAAPEGTSSTPDFSVHSHEKFMNWDETYLCARIFLGRLPASMPGSESDTPERIALGKRLFFERDLSVNDSQSCHDCHILTGDRAGVDSGPTSKGATGALGKRNAPTVINAGFQAAQFWDGRSSTLAEQAKGPILNPDEMAMKTADEVIEQLRKADGFQDAFRSAFPGDVDPITFNNVAEAIAAFERTLVAPGRFDEMLDGRENVLNGQEKRGLTKFIQYHCVECHSGITVGGQLYKIIGQRHPYMNKDDLGRHDVTKGEGDRYVFKVPMLRNVTRTPPYFHDGQTFTLEEAVAKMGWLQLDLRLTSGDIADLIAFLHTLEGSPSPIEAPQSSLE
jgi:cytochrome c peroxidase